MSQPGELNVFFLETEFPFACLLYTSCFSNNKFAKLLPCIASFLLIFSHKNVLRWSGRTKLPAFFSPRRLRYRMICLFILAFCSLAVTEWSSVVLGMSHYQNGYQVISRMRKRNSLYQIYYCFVSANSTASVRFWGNEDLVAVVDLHRSSHVQHCPVSWPHKNSNRLYWYTNVPRWYESVEDHPPVAF